MLEGICTWCNEFAPLTDDHVFPRSIGGTKHLKLPSCEKCQRTISAAETELSRRSIFAVYLVESGPAGRDKRRSTSGAIRSDYVLNRHPLGGYGEAVLKAGGGAQGLPYIEIDVASATPSCNR